MKLLNLILGIIILIVGILIFFKTTFMKTGLFVFVIGIIFILGAKEEK